MRILRRGLRGLGPHQGNIAAAPHPNIIRNESREYVNHTQETLYYDYNASMKGCKSAVMQWEDFRQRFKLGRASTLKEALVFFLFFLVVIAISFFRDRNIELGFAIFAFELVVFGNIQFAGTGWAERDLRLHAF